MTETKLNYYCVMLSDTMIKNFPDQKHFKVDFSNASKWSTRNGMLTCILLNEHVKMLAEDSYVPPNVRVWDWLKANKRACAMPDMMSGMMPGMSMFAEKKYTKLDT
jgi:hypothetical protein